ALASPAAARNKGLAPNIRRASAHRADRSCRAPRDRASSPALFGGRPAPARPWRISRAGPGSCSASRAPSACLRVEAPPASRCCRASNFLLRRRSRRTRGHRETAFVILAAMRWIIVLALLASCKDKPEVDAGPATVAAKDTSPAKAPPALRSPHPPVPSLPDLPALAKHEPAAPLPGN